jgi:capsid protein
VTWHAPRPVPIDRNKEISADVAEVNAGVQSLSGIIRSRGADPSTVFAELEADKARLEAMGINTSSVLGTEPGAVEVVEVEGEPDADEA